MQILMFCIYYKLPSAFQLYFLCNYFKNVFLHHIDVYYASFLEGEKSSLYSRLYIHITEGRITTTQSHPDSQHL